MTPTCDRVKHRSDLCLQEFDLDPLFDWLARIALASEADLLYHRAEQAAPLRLGDVRIVPQLEERLGRVRRLGRHYELGLLLGLLQRGRRALLGTLQLG